MTERIAFIGFGEAAAATAARQQWIADLGVKERLGGKKTEDRAELVRAIREAMGK
jgi:L-alanine-DL-glutamate epimerase-like enolase superfamily enzyme